MNPEVKKIANKLFLATHNVELGLIDEISKDLSTAFSSQDVESEILGAVMKLEKSLPIYKSIVAKCDEALIKIKDLGLTGGVDKKVMDQKNEAVSAIKSIEFRMSGLSKLRK